LGNKEGRGYTEFHREGAEFHREGEREFFSVFLCGSLCNSVFLFPLLITNLKSRIGVTAVFIYIMQQ